MNCEREQSGKIKVSGVLNDGSPVELTQQAEFVPLNGNVKFENGCVTGNGTFAVKIPLDGGGYLYSKSVSFDDTQKDHTADTSPSDENEDTDIIKYVVFACCGAMVIGGLVFFGVLKKNSFKTKKK